MRASRRRSFLAAAAAAGTCLHCYVHSGRKRVVLQTKLRYPPTLRRPAPGQRLPDAVHRRLASPRVGIVHSWKVVVDKAVGVQRFHRDGKPLGSRRIKA